MYPTDENHVRDALFSNLRLYRTNAIEAWAVCRWYLVKSALRDFFFLRVHTVKKNVESVVLHLISSPFFIMRSGRAALSGNNVEPNYEGVHCF
jgi:hypothetical protein